MTAAPGAGAVDDEEALAGAVDAVDAPDVVFGLSRDGRRTVLTGGTGRAPAVPRERLRYEIGSASKTFTGLLLAHLEASGRLSGAEPAARCFDPRRALGRNPITLAHLITHTSGLPPLPADFYPQAVRRWATNPYAHYPADRVVRAFLRARPRHRPGTRWRYSNFAVASLGHALSVAEATPWDELLSSRVLRPLGLSGTALRPAGPGTDATGHGADGVRRTPPLDIGGFAAAGAVRATVHDLLGYLEAHLRPEGHPLAGALREVRRPVLRRGPRHRHVHTLTWFRHATDHGHVYFHSGATSGQQAFLGFSPDTGTALVAVSTRRFRLRDRLIPVAYGLLTDAGAPGRDSGARA
ncbi:serine hydrolase domain-containing protein [Streptomyces sp. t39]|uniref:serine hydrolase domain-containing protein n=1 Tax=Streptomyces sp. t39 TaxID=1828156 RepID=UPI0011CEBC81|nr:serine hydrolase domain-containing protein [Streptomyces sp. t39]TXS52124.1 class A beta-lactamase-related serine hydrolase [Streptomyces sp. t39]